MHSAIIRPCVQAKRTAGSFCARNTLYLKKKKHFCGNITTVKALKATSVHVILVLWMGWGVMIMRQPAPVLVAQGMVPIDGEQRLSD